MAEIFELYGKLETNTQPFINALQRADARLTETAKHLADTEKKAESLGQTTSVSARAFERLQDKLALANQRMMATAVAFGKGEATAKQMASALKSVESATNSVNSKLKDTAARIADIKAKGRNFLSELNLGSIGNAAAAGGVAGATAAGINAAIDLTKQLTSAMFDAGKQAVMAGASFQRTNSALSVFAGSASEARRELQAIANLSATTAGLRLGPSEQGYQRLRAVGFNEKLSLGLVKELGEEKILSGAEDEAVQRVLFNFSQIATGGQKVSQEIREIITAMPTLSRAFQDAFGTLDPQKLQGFFDASSSDAFQKLVDSMAKGKTASGGLTDALGKLEDEYLKSQRIFAEPIMAPLTDSIKMLTAYLTENKDTFKDWGTYVANVIRGVNHEIERRRKSPDRADLLQDLNMQAAPSVLRAALALPTLGISEAIIKAVDNTAATGARVNAYLTRSTDPTGAAATIQDALQANIEKVNRQNLSAAERQRRTAIETASTNSSNRLLVGTASIQSNLSPFGANSMQIKQNEISQLRQLGNLKADVMREELRATINAYQEQTKAAEGNSAEQLQIITEQFNKTSQIRAKIQANELDTQRAIAEKERQIFEERKKLQEDFNKFRAQGAIELIKNPFEKIAAEGRFAASEAFDRFKDLGAGPANEAANLERLKAQKRLSEELKNQVDAVRNIAVSQSDNPYVRLFADARDAIEQARESTKYLSKEIQNAVIGGAQAQNLRNLFNARVDTALDASNLRQQASAIFFNQQISATDALRNQYGAIQNSNVDQATKMRRTAEIFSGANPADVPNELRAIAYEALLKEASRREAFEKEGMKFYENFNKLIGTMGLKVDLGGQAITQIEVTSEKLAVKGVSLPSRGSGGIKSFRDGSSVRSATTLSNPFIKK
jgi:tape measure domain-containing protein